MGLFGPAVEQRRYEDIGSWMLEGKAPLVPQVLRGVFFMDGNPLAEDCGTFQGLPWDEERLAVLVPMTGHLQWTYSDSVRGRGLLTSAKLLRNHLEIRFEDASLTRARVTPIFFGFLRWPWWLTHHTLERVEGDETGDSWRRENTRNPWRKPFGGYTLRRVVREDGEETEALADMLGKIPPTCLCFVHDPPPRALPPGEGATGDG